jgi:chemotaxis methyl-accepting protein methylase
MSAGQLGWCRKALSVGWHLADLATVNLGRSFDVIVMAGNVMIFLSPGSETAVVENMARHLREDRLLVAGFHVVLTEYVEHYNSYRPHRSVTGADGA